MPQYSTVTALVLRYSMRASSPVDENKTVSVKQHSVVEVFWVTEGKKGCQETSCEIKTGSVIVILIQNC